MAIWKNLSGTTKPAKRAKPEIVGALRTTKFFSEQRKTLFVNNFRIIYKLFINKSNRILLVLDPLAITLVQQIYVKL